MVKKLEARITAHAEKGLTSADHTMSILAFAIKGKTQMREGSRENLQISPADETQMDKCGGEAEDTGKS